MLNYLVRAYYEIHGSFDGIMKESFFKRIVDEASVMDISVIEFCYRGLGYSFDNMHTAEYRESIRRLAIDPDNTELLRKKFSIAPSKELMPVLKTFDFLPTFFKTPVKVKDSPLARVIASYVETTEHLTMYDEEDDSEVSMGYFFSGLKLNSDFTKLKKIIPSYAELIKELLKQVVIRESVQDPMVVDSTILVGSEFDLDTVARDVCLHIGCRFFTMPQKHYYGLLKRMFFYQVNSMTNVSNYLAVLDLANCYNMTVKSLIESIGFRYVNQLDIFEESGVFIYQINNSAFEILNPLGESTQRIALDFSQLRDLYAADALRFLGTGDNK